jgi:hypothetical protein
LVNRPLPPISAKGLSKIMSPVVFIMIISTAPSSANSVCAAFSFSRVSWAWARARGLSYIVSNLNYRLACVSKIQRKQWKSSNWTLKKTGKIWQNPSLVGFVLRVF